MFQSLLAAGSFAYIYYVNRRRLRTKGPRKALETSPDDTSDLEDLLASDSGEDDLDDLAVNLSNNLDTHVLPGRAKVYVKTFGCSHNTSDAEFMMGQLAAYGFQLTADPESADACVVNSCTVKNPSQDSAVLLASRLKASGKAVVVTGCVPQADRGNRDLEAFSLVGVEQIDKIVFAVEESLKGNRIVLLEKRKDGNVSLDLPKIRRNKLIEIIPISSGCLGACTYCKTKHARGDLGSYRIEAIIARIRQAVAEGVRQIWFTSEDLGAFGLDIGTNIAELVERVAVVLETEFPKVMLRLGMTNPPYMLEHAERIARLLSHPQIFSFLHIPVQSGSDSVLRVMKREYSNEDFSRLIQILKNQVPNITIATDIICGFPGETDEDHQASLDLISQHKFPVLNISQFYARPGTPAARMKRLSAAVVKKRSTEVTSLFETYGTNERYLGQTVKVWFDEIDPSRGQTVGHTKEYTKVVISDSRPDLLGESGFVEIGNFQKWHISGMLV